MKIGTRTSARLATMGAITLSLATLAAAAEPYCSQATLSGTYVTFGSGTLGARTTGAAAYASVGKVTYDGHGNGVATDTASVSGAISRSTTTGTYTVKADCTGSKNFGGSGGINFDFVVTADGREIFFLVTNDGAVLSGRAVRLDNSRN